MCNALVEYEHTRKRDAFTPKHIDSRNNITTQQFCPYPTMWTCVTYIEQVKIALSSLVSSYTISYFKIHLVKAGFTELYQTPSAVECKAWQIVSPTSPKFQSGVTGGRGSSVFSELITSAARFVNHAAAPLAPPTNYLTSFPPRHLLSPSISVIAMFPG